MTALFKNFVSQFFEKTFKLFLSQTVNVCMKTVFVVWKLHYCEETCDGTSAGFVGLLNGNLKLENKQIQ